MTDTNQAAERTSGTETTTTTVDVAVVGAGPAGCAAGVFCARAGLETVVIANGRSTLQKCAFVENYLGFPAGIAPRELLMLAQEHLERTPCERRETTVESVSERDGTFRLKLAEGMLDADRIIAASWSKSDYLATLGVETEPEDDGPVDEIVTDDQGRTSVEGVYAAGRITGTHHQALVNAGDGARVALHVVKTVTPEFYNDWVVPEGYYEQYDREVPVGVEEIDHETRAAREEQARTWMRTFFKDSSE